MLNISKRLNSELQYILAIQATEQAIEMVGKRLDLIMKLDYSSLKMNNETTDRLYNCDIINTLFLLENSLIIANSKTCRALNQ